MYAPTAQLMTSSLVLVAPKLSATDVLPACASRLAAPADKAQTEPLEVSGGEGGGSPARTDEEGQVPPRAEADAFHVHIDAPEAAATLPSPAGAFAVAGTLENPSAGIWIYPMEAVNNPPVGGNACPVAASVVAQSEQECMSPRTRAPPAGIAPAALAGAAGTTTAAVVPTALAWRSKGLRAARLPRSRPPPLPLSTGCDDVAFGVADGAVAGVGSAPVHGPSSFASGCHHCGCTQSPQWRKGPPHKPVLCNACGARFLRTHRLDGGAGSCALNAAGPTSADVALGSLVHASAYDMADTAQTPPPKKAAARAAVAAEAAARAARLAAAAEARAAAAVAAAAAAAAVSAPPALAAQQPRRPMRARAADGTAVCTPPPPFAPPYAPLRRLSDGAAQQHALDAPASPVQAGPATRVVPFSPGPAAAANVLLLLLAAASGDDAGAALGAGGESGGENEEEAAAAAAAARANFQRRRSSNAGALRAAASRAAPKRPRDAADADAMDADAYADADGGALMAVRLPKPLPCASPRKRPRGRSPQRSRPVARPAVARRPAAAGFGATVVAAEAAFEFVTASPAAVFRQKAHRPWSLLEVAALVEGVAHYGRGQWADIKALDSPFTAPPSAVPAGPAAQPASVAAALAARSAVDLKDKWRNLLRVATAPGAAAEDGAPPRARRDVPGEVPTALLSRVRALAAARASPPPPAVRSAAAAAPSVSAVLMGDEAVAAVPPVVAAKPAGARRSKHHSPWTLEEATALVDGVARAGGCRWTVVKKMSETGPTAPLARRSAIDLKDKWRNLLSLARLPAAGRRRAAETPAPLLQRVLELENRYGVARRRGRRGGAADVR